MLRISFFELKPCQSIIKSAENQINVEEVQRFYKGERFPEVSLNDELDSFYEKCLTNNVELDATADVAQFFLAKMLTFDQQSILAKQFRNNEETRISYRARKYEKTLLNKLKEFSILEERNNIRELLVHVQDRSETVRRHYYDQISNQRKRINLGRQKSKNNYIECIDRMNQDFKLKSKLPEVLDYNLFLGFRATCEFNLQKARPTRQRVARTLKKIFSPSLIIDKEQIRQSIFEDFNQSRKDEDVNSPQ